MPDPSVQMKRALVLEGGGAKGAYAFGCLTAFEEEGWQFDIVTGTSVGALNAALWSTRMLTAGKSIWLGLSQETIFPWRTPQVLARIFAPIIIFANLLAGYMFGNTVPRAVRIVCNWLILLPPLLLMTIWFAMMQSMVQLIFPLGFAIAISFLNMGGQMATIIPTLFFDLIIAVLH